MRSPSRPHLPEALLVEVLASLRANQVDRQDHERARRAATDFHSAVTEDGLLFRYFTAREGDQIQGMSTDFAYVCNCRINEPFKAEAVILLDCHPNEVPDAEREKRIRALGWRPGGPPGGPMFRCPECVARYT